MIKWEEQLYQGRLEWMAQPCEYHSIDIWEHEKEGYAWCVGTDDGADDTPEGWSATLDDAKRHAEAAYREWVLEQPNGTAQFLAQLHALEQKLAEARAEVARERDAVVAWLRGRNFLKWEADAIERGEHRREEGA
jgi:hypothetical protein